MYKFCNNVKLVWEHQYLLFPFAHSKHAFSDGVFFKRASLFQRKTSYFIQPCRNTIFFTRPYFLLYIDISVDAVNTEAVTFQQRLCHITASVLEANCGRIFASVLVDVSGGAATSITIIQEILIILGAGAPLHSPQMSSCSCSYTEVTVSSCINFIFQRREQIIISSGAKN